MATAQFTTTYNPGTATIPVKIAAGQYDVDSFRGEAKAYRVDVIAGTCTCPHYTGRLAGTGQDCKHLKTCRAHHAAELAQKAAQQPTEALTALLARYEAAGRFDIALAVRGELFDRMQQEVGQVARLQAIIARDVELKAVFA